MSATAARGKARNVVAAVVALYVVLAATGHHVPALPSPASVIPELAGAAPAPASVSGNVALGRRLAAGYGWGSGGQWNCLYDLWQRESGWSNTAENSQSGAYGVAQALGHGPTNQYPAGPANPPVSSAAAQEKWGLSYIDQRYGSPCGAWSHEENSNWY